MIRVNTLFKFVLFHPDNHQILTCGTDRKVGYWETYDGSMIRELEGSKSGSINALGMSSKGTAFVSGGDDRLVKVLVVCYSLIGCAVVYLSLVGRAEQHAN